MCTQTPEFGKCRFIGFTGFIGYNIRIYRVWIPHQQYECFSGTACSTHPRLLRHYQEAMCIVPLEGLQTDKFEKVSYLHEIASVFKVATIYLLPSLKPTQVSVGLFAIHYS